MAFNDSQPPVIRIDMQEDETQPSGLRTFYENEISEFLNQMESAMSELSDTPSMTTPSSSEPETSHPKPTARRSKIRPLVVSVMMVPDESSQSSSTSSSSTHQSVTSMSRTNRLRPGPAIIRIPDDPWVGTYTERLRESIPWMNHNEPSSDRVLIH